MRCLSKQYQNVGQGPMAGLFLLGGVRFPRGISRSASISESKQYIIDDFVSDWVLLKFTRFGIQP